DPLQIILQNPLKVFLRECRTSWGRLIYVVDVAKDVATHGDTARSRSRPAGGRCHTRAALRERLYCSKTPLQLGNLLREVETQAALLGLQRRNSLEKCSALSGVVGRHREISLPLSDGSSSAKFLPPPGAYGFSTPAKISRSSVSKMSRLFSAIRLAQ